MDLFETANQNNRGLRPLAESMRPRDLESYIGQLDSLENLKLLLRNPMSFPNLILWGPPGTGKTTLALIIARELDAEEHLINAVDAGAKQLRDLGNGARHLYLQNQRKTLVFIDEIHRLNRAQQDVLLPFTESGDIILVGATTENPSYELNSALLSRCRVIVLERHSTSNLSKIYHKAWAQYSVASEQVVAAEIESKLLELADGDARKLLNAIELIYQTWTSKEHQEPLSLIELSRILQSPQIRYDKTGSEHYDVISAFIKSVRGSDPDAAIYYLARMLEGGEDPVFIARRLVVLASEDVGNADPRAISVAIAGLQAVELVGMPEARINLAQVVTYLSCAPKSNASYQAINEAISVVKETGTLPVPLALRSARTKLTRELGYGAGYEYAHEGDRGWKEMDFLPDPLLGKQFYRPVDRGFEKTIREYLSWVKKKL